MQRVDDFDNLKNFLKHNSLKEFQLNDTGFNRNIKTKNNVYSSNKSNHECNNKIIDHCITKSNIFEPISG